VGDRRKEVGMADPSVRSSTGATSQPQRSAAPTQSNGGDDAAATGDESVAELLKALSTQTTTLVHQEIELAKAELRADAKNAARAGVMFAVAAVFGAFLLVMLLIALGEGLVAAGLWRWAAYLVIAGVLAVLAGIVAVIGLRSVKSLGPPERTITTAKDTLAWAKHPTQQQVPS